MSSDYHYDIHSIAPCAGVYAVLAQHNDDGTCYVWKAPVVAWALVTSVPRDKAQRRGHELYLPPLEDGGRPVRDVVPVVAEVDNYGTTDIDPDNMIGLWLPSDGPWDEARWQKLAEES
jgi:hypothetical protein